MNAIEAKKEFYKRFSIECSFDYQEELKKFKTRIQYSFLGQLFDRNEAIEIASFLGEQINTKQFVYGDVQWNKVIFDILLNSTSSEELFFKLQVILDFSARQIKKNFISKIKRDIENSPINIIAIEKNTSLILIPAGENLLDRELIENALSFLDEKSNGLFVEALKLYQNKKWRLSCTEIRKSIEEFLRFKLNNTKNLANNLNEILVKSVEVKEIKNLIRDNFDKMDKFFNENEKHKTKSEEKLGEAENEFVIYQAALLMRYINKKIQQK